MMIEMKEDREKIIEAIGEAARINERDYHGCCRSVLQALQVNLGLKDAAVIKSATALGGECFFLLVCSRKRDTVLCGL